MLLNSLYVILPNSVFEISSVRRMLAIGLCFLVTLCLSCESMAKDPNTSEEDPRAHLGERNVTASKLSGKIMIDGKLNEPGWQTAEESVGFVERVPKPGADPPVLSSIRVLYDEDALYVGVKMEYEAGQPPVAWELRRDNGSIWSDDAITLKIDPRADKRTTLGFALNSAGANLDLIALDNGLSFLTEYDMVWEGATSIDERAWCAEYRIPYAALAFEAGDDSPEPGIALSRDHPARQATDDWTLLPPEFGPASAMHYGTLKGLKGVDGGRPLVMMPYLSLSSLDAARPVGGLDIGNLVGGRVGGDIRANLGDGVWAEISALTDFAQVDLDNALLNLTRFPLLYPERRPFFLNGTDIFSFGTSAAQPFFSRRIGLTNSGEEVPIYGGAKIYSRSGKFRYGLLSTVSGRSPGNAEESLDGIESATIGRARYEINDGYVGLLMTHLQRTENKDDLWETGYGLDVNQRFLNKRLEVSGTYSGLLNSDTSDQESIKQPVSGRAEVKWRGADYQSNLSYLYVDETYLPQLGFVRRPNVSQISSGIDRVFYRPLGLNRVSLGIINTLSWDAHFNSTLDREIAGSIFVKTLDGWIFDSMFGYNDRAVVREDFELSGIKVPVGNYQGPLGYIALLSPVAGARWNFGALYMYDDSFFGGTSHTFRPNLRLSLSRHLRLTADYTYSAFTLPETSNEASVDKVKDFEGNEQALNGGMVITPNVTTQIDLVGQLNTQTEQWLGLARLRWRWLPGSDLFLVYRLKTLRDHLDPNSMSTSSKWRLGEQQLMFKMVWRTDVLY